MSFASAVSAHPSRPIGPSDPMPFGKHKGILIRDIPRDYMIYVLDKHDIYNPDNPSYWPELRAAFESIVGKVPSRAPQPAAPNNGQSLSLTGLCTCLAAEKVRLAVKDGKLIVTEGCPLSDTVADALELYEGPLLRLLSCVETGQSPRNGSAKLIWAADLRCRVKAWYGKLSRQFHPDAGGNPAAQTAVNQCYRDLMNILSEWESKP